MTSQRPVHEEHCTKQGHSENSDSHLSRSGRACTEGSALEHALIARFGTLGRVPASFLLRPDNGLVFTSRSYTALVRGYGLR